MKTNLMNRMLRRFTSAGVSAGLALCALQAQDDKPVEPKFFPKPQPLKSRPLAEAQKPDRSGPVKNVPFLGLVLGSVDEATAAQLDLPEGTGVLVRAVMPDSPAAKAGVLQHDVLRYFNDQLLTNEPQLQTLVRQAGVGTEVTLKLLRKGKEETITVKVGEHAMSENEQREGPQPLRWHGGEYDYRPAPNAFGLPRPDARMHNSPLNSDRFADQVRDLSERMKKLEGKPDQMREEVERFRREIQEQTNRAQEEAGRARGAIERQEGARRNSEGPRSSASSSATSDHGGIRVEVYSNDRKVGSGDQDSITARTDDKGNVIVTQGTSTHMAWNDGDGSGELLIENGKKKLSVKDREGKQIFIGPVDTDEQRKDLPPGVRERLERIEKNVKVRVAPPGGKEEL